jgi:hypothetical protein
MVEDYDEYDDFDPMNDDESSEDFYITQVINKYKKLPREKIIKALDDTDWDVDKAVKLLKTKDQPAKPGKQPVSSNLVQGKQGAKTGAGPALTATVSVSSSNSSNQSCSGLNKPTLSAASSVSIGSSVDSGKKTSGNENVRKVEESRKGEESKIAHARLNQNYPDVHPTM